MSSLAPRLVILSSGVHNRTNLEKYRDEDKIYSAMTDKDKFDPYSYYPASKLLDTLWTRELGERLQSSKHPEDHKISLSG